MLDIMWKSVAQINGLLCTYSTWTWRGHPFCSATWTTSFRYKPFLPLLSPFFADLLHKELSVSSLDLSSYDGSQSPGSGGTLTPNCRTKRMRTSFKHHQLRTMKSYFAINQNPDAKDLKQLAQKTGLSKRVLQVRLQTIVFANFMFTNFEN